jgi:hypothetical protein
MATAELQPHRAAYRLKLASSAAAIGFVDVRGALVLEWRAGCDGWLSQQRLGFVAATEEGDGLSYDVRFSSWESRDRTRIRFTLRSFDGPQMYEEYRGEAALTAPGGAGRARYVRPEAIELELPAGTMFPTEQIARLIEDARAGRRFTHYTVFDGSGPDALNTVSAVIGEPKRILLADGRSLEQWPVALAYFPPESTADEPAFEIAFDLDERGILYDVRLDYGDFVLEGELDRLELLEPETCD